jgi:hypothetical protein
MVAAIGTVATTSGKSDNRSAYCAQGCAIDIGADIEGLSSLAANGFGSAGAPPAAGDSLNVAPVVVPDSRY